MRVIIATAILWATAALLSTSTVREVYAAANNIPQAPVGHRQPRAQDVQGGQQHVQSGQDDNSADQAMKKIDEDLKKKLNGICRGC
jgi:hypothetical protein